MTLKFCNGKQPMYIRVADTTGYPIRLKYSKVLHQSNEPSNCIVTFVVTFVAIRITPYNVS